MGFPTMGGMLTGSEIDNEVKAGNIQIMYYDVNNLNPNSYNLRCSNVVTMYDRSSPTIDLKNPDTFKTTNRFAIDPNTGFTMRPGNLYLIPTYEKVSTDKYIPLITGRSSIGRLGISIHQEAGFGDIGFSGNWTLQIRVTYPTVIYPFLEIAQVYFITPYGKATKIYTGRYQNADGALSSRWGG